ncbi:aldehyde dehydrogenase family protein [Ktedonosporobacter rubrisoli]|nr:aldehyde dehydrogenase family protein [Ktedonosporobacter rubrisoli]
MATTQRGSPQFPTMSYTMPASTPEEMDAAIQVLQTHKDTWAMLPVRTRITLLDQLIHDFMAISARWVAAGQQAKGIAPNSPLAGEEWSSGTWPVLKNLTQLRQSLSDIETHGQPRIPGPVTARPDHQVVAQVFPISAYDRLFFTGITAEVWMEPGVTIEGLASTQALAYREKQPTGKVALVLGAGNVASIAPMDILYKLFIENQVTLLKMNPVNAYLGPLLAEGFRALVDGGFLRIVYGGASEGSYLCKHGQIDEIHITGSDKTFEAIVFGPGKEGAQRKAEQRPLLTRRITGELGNVSPVIVVPGPWSESDLAYQAAHIVTSLTNNAGFNCNASRVIIQHKQWSQRDALLQKVRKTLAQVPTREAYYPGAQERQRLFLEDHPQAELFGTTSDKELPWTLIADVAATQDNEICFTTEAFCGLFAETALEAEGILDYLDRAVEFANEELWGTLNATLIIHPATLKSPEVREALDRAIANLRYGTIGLNYWAATGYALAVTPWGAFPGHDIYNIQSGTGVVHNTLMFSRSQKTVLRAPFRSIPTPPWFVTRGKAARKVFARLTSMEATPSVLQIPAILWDALRD